jgi:pyridoxamine 5'-phosphate oxidase
VARVPAFRDELRVLPVLSSGPHSFDVSTAPDRPEALFLDWFRAAVAAGETEPHAMTLSTCDAEGNPDARVLILKDLDEDGWWFATSSASGKGQQLEQRPVAALTFYWRTLGRQVRIRGTVLGADAERSADDFRGRSAAARAVALASRVSQPLADDAECTHAVAAARRALDADPDLTSPTWALYSVRPDEVEFWQADPDRLHTRLRYGRAGSRWQRNLLWP